jgi:hypothetical protein
MTKIPLKITKFFPLSSPQKTQKRPQKLNKRLEKILEYFCHF